MVKIKEYRLKLGISQAVLAEKVGLTDSAITQYEKGKRMPSVPLLKKIANVLNCSMDELFESEELEGVG